jgi:hypothetical protein
MHSLALAHRGRNAGIRERVGRRHMRVAAGPRRELQRATARCGREGRRAASETWPPTIRARARRRGLPRSVFLHAPGGRAGEAARAWRASGRRLHLRPLARRLVRPLLLLDADGYVRQRSVDPVARHRRSGRLDERHLVLACWPASMRGRLTLLRSRPASGAGSHHSPEESTTSSSWS